MKPLSSGRANSNHPTVCRALIRLIIALLLSNHSNHLSCAHFSVTVHYKSLQLLRLHFRPSCRATFAPSPGRPEPGEPHSWRRISTGCFEASWGNHSSQSSQWHKKSGSKWIQMAGTTVLDYSIKNADMACHMGFNFNPQGQNQARICSWWEHVFGLDLQLRSGKNTKGSLKKWRFSHQLVTVGQDITPNYG